MFKATFILAGLVVAGSQARAAGYGFDVGSAPAVHVQQLADAGLTGRQGTWMRVRGLAEPSRIKTGDARTVATERATLLALRARGIKTAVLLRWGPAEWMQGVRAGGGQRLPLDLREVFTRGRDLAAAYGDLVDAWEIENEPDIDFVAENPETYAAFQKAVYLGLHDGAQSEPKVVTAPSSWNDRKRGFSTFDQSELSRISPVRVVMAPLALPPGPYLERLWANGIAAYTDGFNFHYYGYAEDFTGVYGQFYDAIRKLSAAEAGAGSANPAMQKSLPVFVTEYGYGLLDADSRDTIEGRVRQLSWFASLARQIRTLRPEAPMVFVWNPYYEANLNEFGLTMKPAAGSATEGMRFTPAELGETQIQPWMRRIGTKTGDTYASPALAYLWNYAETHPYRARDWTITTGRPSRLVLDFVADEGLVQRKSWGGYHVSDEGGKGRIVVYNFSGREVSGVVNVGGTDVRSSVKTQALTLADGERREIAVELGVQAEVLAGRWLRAEFIPNEGTAGRALWVSRLYPSTQGMRGVPERDFEFAASEAAVRQEKLAARVPAVGEPALRPQGRWLVTDGVRVEESDGVWRFHIDHLPNEPMRPAMAELPLPEGFAFEPGTALSLQRRRATPETPRPVSQVDGTAVSAGRLKPRAGAAGNMMDVYFRMENGNLFQTWPRLRVGDAWATYIELADSFTMAFFGRAELPWKFADNRPAALVFFLRPAEVPAVFEVRDAQIVRVTK